MPISESLQNQRERRRSITESLKRVFRSQDDSHRVVAHLYNARRGVRGRRISDPILPVGGLPLPALVRPAPQPHESIRISHPSGLSRSAGASDLWAANCVSQQGRAAPRAVVQPTLPHPKRAQSLNPNSLSRRVRRTDNPVFHSTVPQGDSPLLGVAGPPLRHTEEAPLLDPPRFSKRARQRGLNPTLPHGNSTLPDTIRPKAQAPEPAITNTLVLQGAGVRSSLRVNLTQPKEQPKKRPSGAIPTAVVETTNGSGQGDSLAQGNSKTIGISQTSSGKSPSSIDSVPQAHLWQNIRTDEVFKKLLQTHAFRERFKDSLSRLGDSGPALLDIWLAAKAQKAAQEYAEALLGEVRQIASKTLGSSAAETGEMIDRLAFKKLLSTELPRDINIIIKNWLSSATINDAINFNPSGSDSPTFPGLHLAASQGKFRDLFKSFSISDPREPAHPRRLSSKVSLDGESLLPMAFTNRDQPCTIHTAYDPRGEPSSYSLLLTAPLVSQTTGKTRYLLTLHVDITQFVLSHVADTLLITEATSDTKVQGELDAAISGAYREHVGSYPRLRAMVLLDNAFRWGITGKPKPLDEIGSATAEAKASKTPATAGWLRIQYEDRRKKYNMPEEPHTSSAGFPALVKGIKLAYREYFTLSPSTEDREVYEISYVSPMLLAEGEHVTGHLTHTAPQVVRDITAGLARHGTPTLPP
jgi:hypothetical protein